MAPGTKLPSSLALGQLRPRATAAAALPRAFSHAAAPIATATATTRPSASRTRPALQPPTLTPIRLAHTIPKPPAAIPRTPRRRTNQEETEEAEAEEEADEEGSAAGQQAKRKKYRAPLGPNESPRPDMPARNPQAYYQLSMTCVPCGHRSHHNISRQGYHRGSVLVACPGCKNRHVVSDHLGVFGDGGAGVTVEDLLRDKGQIVRRGSLGEDGDVEFWPEDTER